MAVICFVLTVAIILAGFLIRALIDDFKECKRQEKLELYRKAELIGKWRLIWK